MSLGALLLSSTSLFAWEYKVNPWQLGVRSSFLDRPNPLEQAQPFIGNHSAFYFENAHSGASFNLDFKLAQDFSKNQRTQFIPHDATFNYKANSWSVAAGMQTLSFSETFGINIMDIANPRDYRLGIFDDLEWSKRPVPLLATKFFFDSFNLDLYFSPYSEHDRPANLGSAYDPLRSSVISRSESNYHQMEGGFRLNTLLEEGLDLSFIYYRHLNRYPLYYLDRYTLKAVKDQVDSFGLTYSYSFESLVLRGDYLFTVDQPKVDSEGQLSHRSLQQLILGADWSTDTGHTLGTQLFYRGFFHQRADYWAGVQWQYAGESYAPSLMIYSGINNADRWIRPEIVYKGIASLELKARADILFGRQGEGQLSPFEKADRLEVQAVYFY